MDGGISKWLHDTKYEDGTFSDTSAPRRFETHYGGDTVNANLNEQGNGLALLEGGACLGRLLLGLVQAILFEASLCVLFS